MDPSALINPRKPEFWLIATVVGTIIGNVGMALLVAGVGAFGLRDWAGQLLLFAVAVVLVLGFGPRVAGYFRRQPDGSEVRQLNDIDSAPVMIVLVSTNPKGPFTTAINAFATAQASTFRHLFLIHSPESKGIASGIYDDVNNGNRRYRAYKDGLEADFSSVESVKRAAELAIRHAQELPHIAASDIVIDITGGTSVASAGAVLAAMESPDVTVTYIPQSKLNTPGVALKRIDIRFAYPS